MQRITNSLNGTNKIELHKQSDQTMIVQHSKDGGRRTTFMRGAPGDVARHLRKYSEVEIVIKF